MDDDRRRRAFDKGGAQHARAIVAIVGGDGLAVERQLEQARAAQVLRDDAQRVAVLVDAVLEDRRLPRTGDQRTLPRREAQGCASSK